MFNFMKKIFNTNEDASMPFILKYNKIQSNTMNYSDLFFENPCINRALNLITNSIADLELVVIKNGKFNSNSLVYKILKNPSKGTYTSDFIESLVLNYLLSGNAFIYLDDNNNLVNLISDNVQIHFDKLHNDIAFYSIKTGENKFIKISADSKLPMIGHFKSANPSNPFLGYSALDSVKLSATLYQYIDRHNLSLIQNGGRPSGIVSINSAEPLTEKEQESLKEQFTDQYLGPDQAGKIIFLNREFSWQQLSGSIKDMDYSDASRRALRAIAAGLGVPANLIGDLSTAGENAKRNIESMFEIFNKTTISPLAKKLSQFLTMFFKDFEYDIEVKLISKEEFNLILEDSDKINKDFSL